MMVDKRGGKTKDTGMVKFPFSICSRKIDHLESLMQHFARCDEITEDMRDLTFYCGWKKMKDMGNNNCEALAKMFFLQGASSKLVLLPISGGMTPLVLEGMGEGK